MGACKLCGQEMVFANGDAWHPYFVEKACPPATGKFGMSEWGSPGRPGVEYFVPEGQE